MSRLRTIKPEFFTSAQVVEVSIPARLAFVGMWCFSDDSGVHPADVKRLKLEVFPADDCTSSDVKKWTTELICVGLIEQYSALDKLWWRITGWDRHQRIDKPTFRYPLPDGSVPPNGRRRTAQNGDDSTTCLRPFDDMSLRNGTERNGVETESVRPFDAADHLEVWPEAFRRAAETAKKLWPSGRPEPKNGPERTEREVDNAMLLRIAFVSCSLFTDEWLADAIAGTIAKHKKHINNRLGYFKGILSKSAKIRGYVLNELLDGITLPEKKSKAPSASPPELSHIGAMPK